MSARDEVLARIRTALGEDRAPVPEVPRDYRRAGHAPSDAAMVELLVDRVEDYRAAVLRCAPEAIGATVRAALDRGLDEGWAASDVVVAPGLDHAWRPAGCDVDDDRPAVQLADRAAAVTAVAVAIAETGTLVLDGSPACGRRALSLLPDCLVCVVTVDQVVAGVPEGLAALDPVRPLTMISGPSATSDIELQRVEGVHGPRQLFVVLAG